MTKKRFYKLFRAWCTAPGVDRKAVNRLCNKQPGMKKTNPDNRGYAYVWAVITHDGKFADGVGVKTK